jgi:hypothetical protein
VIPGNSEATTELSVSTAVAMNQDGLPFGNSKLALLLFALPAFGIAFSVGGKRRGARRLGRSLLVLALIGVGLQFTACDSPSEPLPPVTTTFTVTASGDGLDRTDTGSITVNP